MVHEQLILVVLLVFVGSIVEGSAAYGKCTKYGPKERIPNARGRDRYCLSDSDGNQYCIFFNCPSTKCNRPLSPSSGQCRYCTDTCSYGGKIYNVGDSFACLDGSNRCRCMDKNGIASTRMASNYQTMCHKTLA